MPIDQQEHDQTPLFLAEGGQMGALIRAYDWSAAALGNPLTWPSPLKILMGIALSSPSPMLICWGTSFIQFYNDAFRPILGENKHPQALGRPVWETYAEIWDTLEPMFENVMKGESVTFQDFKLIMDRNGYEEEVYFDFSYSPIKDENGNIQGVLVICSETTEKVLTMATLKETNRQLVIAKTADALAMKKAEESEERFRTMAESTDIMIGVADESSSAVYFNNAWTKLTGRPMEQLLEFGWADLIHPDERDAWLSTYLEAFKHRVTFEGEFRILDKQGEYRWLLSKGPPRFDQNGRFAGYISSCIDITERKLSEMALARTADKLQAMNREMRVFNNELAAVNQELNIAKQQLEQNTSNLQNMIRQAPVAMCILLGPEHVITVANRLMIELWGKEEANVLNKPVFEALPDARAQGLEDIMKTVYLTGETFTASEMPVTLLRNGKNEIVYQDFVYEPYRGTDGSILGLIAITIDVTERKLDDIRKNDFIGMVSHELKTPLTSMKGYIQMLLMKSKKQEDSFAASSLEKANAQIGKMTKMINGFLNVSRLESGKIHIDLKRFDLGLLIQEVKEEFTATVFTHKLVFDAMEGIEVNADRDKIGQVIHNLVSNAIKYSPAESSVSILCRKVGNTAQIHVTDTGMGIKSEHLPKLFERYYRVEDGLINSISGFGIGLYLSAEIVHRHHGEIWVESEFGQGSSFSFSLPLSLE